MPSAYVRNRAALKAEIVGRAAAGERIGAICGAAGMPCGQTVRAWAAADPLFAAELAAARRRGDWRRGWQFDEGKAAVLLTRARAGEGVQALLREGGMPGRLVYDRWRAGQAPFAEATFALRARSNAALGELGRARRRGFDQALADRIVAGLNGGGRLDAVLAGDPDLPCRPTLRRWRREQPAFDLALKAVLAAARARRARTIPTELAAFVVDWIKDGESFASLARKGFASRTTLRRWYRADADFARAVDEACWDREEDLEFQLWIAAERIPPGPPREMTRQIAPFTREIARLRHRPGAVHRRRSAGG
jgi:hypothetical protein